MVLFESFLVHFLNYYNIVYDKIIFVAIKGRNICAELFYLYKYALLIDLGGYLSLSLT